MGFGMRKELSKISITAVREDILPYNHVVLVLGFSNHSSSTLEFEFDSSHLIQVIFKLKPDSRRLKFKIDNPHLQTLL